MLWVKIASVDVMIFLLMTRNSKCESACLLVFIFVIISDLVCSPLIYGFGNIIFCAVLSRLFMRKMLMMKKPPLLQNKTKALQMIK